MENNDIVPLSWILPLKETRTDSFLRKAFLAKEGTPKSVDSDSFQVYFKKQDLLDYFEVTGDNMNCNSLYETSQKFSVSIGYLKKLIKDDKIVNFQFGSGRGVNIFIFEKHFKDSYCIFNKYVNLYDNFFDKKLMSFICSEKLLDSLNINKKKKMIFLLKFKEKQNIIQISSKYKISNERIRQIIEEVFDLIIQVIENYDSLIKFNSTINSTINSLLQDNIELMRENKSLKLELAKTVKLKEIKYEFESPNINTLDFNDESNLSFLNLSIRAIHVLDSLNIFNIKDIKNMDTKLLMMSRNCGIKTAAEIETKRNLIIDYINFLI